MPKVNPDTIEKAIEYGIVIPKVVIKGGILHLHLRPVRQSAKDRHFFWVVVSRPNAEMCGTNRCVMLELAPNSNLNNSQIDNDVCNHKFVQPPFGVFWCENCHVVRQVDIPLEDINQVLKYG